MKYIKIIISKKYCFHKLETFVILHDMKLDEIIVTRLVSFSHSSPIREQVIHFFNYALVVILGGLVCAYAFRQKNPALIIPFALTVAVSYLVSRLIGFVYFRPRPFVSLDLDPVIYMTPFSKSFPSSHAFVSFAIAMLLFTYNKNWGIGALIVAFLIALSRVFVGVHYPSDVLVGAVLGVIVSKLISRVI